MEQVELRKIGHVALLTLSRPESLNAIGRQMAHDLATHFTTIADDADVHVAVLTGSGRAFCAGMDVKERVTSGESGIGIQGLTGQVNPFFPYRSSAFDKPVIAAVNGITLGAGLLLALNADLIVACPDASFEFTEVRHGAVVGWDFGLRAGLPRNVAMELALGQRLTAERAYDVGLVSALAPIDSLIDEALRIAADIASLPQGAIRANRSLLSALAPKVPPELQAEADLAFERSQASPELESSLREFAERARARRDRADAEPRTRTPRQSPWKSF